MNGSKIVITGITGFIGDYFARFLSAYYPECLVIGVARKALAVNRAYTFYPLDLSFEKDVLDMLEITKPDYIFHLAGLVFSYDLDALYHANVISTFNLLSGIQRCKLNTRLIVVGSAAEYGAVLKTDLPVTEKHIAKPQSPYGFTKLWQTQMTQYEMFDSAFVCVGRIFNVIGPGLSERLTTGHLFSQLERIRLNHQEPKLYVGNLALKRDFLDIEDVCFALIALALKGKHKAIYNICSGQSFSFNELLDMYLLGYPQVVEVVVDANQSQNGYVEDIYGCNLKIKNDAGWSPIISIKESINRYKGGFNVSG